MAARGGRAVGHGMGGANRVWAGSPGRREKGKMKGLGGVWVGAAYAPARHSHALAAVLTIPLPTVNGAMLLRRVYSAARRRFTPPERFIMNACTNEQIKQTHLTLKSVKSIWMPAHKRLESWEIWIWFDYYCHSVGKKISIFNLASYLNLFILLSFIRYGIIDWKIYFILELRF